MKKNLLGLAIFLAGAFSITSCKQDAIHRKIVDGLPINADETVIPGLAIQEFHLVIRDAMSVIVPALNRIGTSEPRLPGLSGPVNDTYSFNIADKHYRTAHVVIQFQDQSGTKISPDPISVAGSTINVASVGITIIGSSDLFGFTSVGPAHLTLKLTSIGVPTSNKSLIGNMNFNGQGYNFVFAMVAPGLAAGFQGVFGGGLSGSGTGPTFLPFSARLTYASDLSVDGTLIWENRSGGIHLVSNGSGIVTTDKEKFILD